MSMLLPLPTPVPIRHGVVDREGWLAVADDVRAGGGRLVSLWGSRRPAGAVACAAYAFSSEGGLAWIELPLAEGGGYPELASRFPAAGRMQRAAFDLDGLRAEGAADTRPWLDHGLWQGQALPAPYEFVRVEGEGVHEIAVGPVHAGIIEPGHFRFSVVGEKVLRLEERLGYTHKGIDRRFTELSPLEAHRLAGRVSGDSTVAYAWAFCMALEAAAGCTVPERAQWLRALLLERERVANHLGDLGALGNDAAFGVGLAQFSRLREDWQRLSMRVFGHRLLMEALARRGNVAEAASRSTWTLRAAMSSSRSATRSKPSCGACTASTTSTPACRTASSPPAASPPNWLHSSASPAWRAARAPRPGTCAAAPRCHPTTGWTCRWPPTATATWPRA